MLYLSSLSCGDWPVGGVEKVRTRALSAIQTRRARAVIERASAFHNIWLEKEEGQTLPFSSKHPPPHTHKHIQIHTDIHKHRHTHTYKRHREDFPGGAVVKNSPANARKHGFNPRSGKIPHALEQRSPLSPFATTTEPAWHTYWSPSTKSLCSATREATEMRSLRTATKSSPWSLLLEKVPVQQGRPSTAKNK